MSTSGARSIYKKNQLTHKDAFIFCVPEVDKEQTCYRSIRLGIHRRAERNFDKTCMYSLSLFSNMLEN